MERASNKVGPRIDEALKHDTEGLVRGGHATHAEEWKGSEPSGEDQPLATASPNFTPLETEGDGLTPAELELRAELASFIGRAPYPAVRDQVLATLRENRAPDHLIDLAKQLPAGREFQNLQEIWVGVGGRTEDRAS
ncbi:MAG: DUF2795 domain-containing protein [Frankiaceae bacterium]|nr:DUF2795 domain-containing protein [Frankiaceae bacterium]MBV9869310.1 DUF2795 domain-containing protein [Frankiaceae bacterium]